MESEDLSDAEIRSELQRLQIPHGPITRFTRRTYILAIENAKRQQKPAARYAGSPLKEDRNKHEWLESSQSVRQTRQSGRRKSTPSYRTSSESQGEVVNLTPGLANMPSLDRKHSSERSASSSHRRRRSSVGKSSGSYVRDIPIVKTNESVRSTESTFSKGLSPSTPSTKGGTVNLNDWQDSFEISQPVGIAQRRFKLPDYESSSQFSGGVEIPPLDRRDEYSLGRSFLSDRRDDYGHRKDKRPMVNMRDEYREDTRPVWEKDYYIPNKDSMVRIGDMVNGAHSRLMNAWTVVKGKIGDVFCLNGAKPRHFQRSRWSSYDGDETYGKWQLTDRSSQPILLFILGILLALVVLYTLVAQRKFIGLFGVVICDAFYDTIMFLYKRMLLPLFFIFCLSMVLAAAYFYKRLTARRADEERQQIYAMAEKVTRYLKNHYRKCVELGIKDKFLPVPHVRDHLIPIAQRKQLAPIWEMTVQFICENESRIRTETHRVSGEEFLVWQWIQIAGSEEDDKESVVASTRHEVGVPPLQDHSDCLKVRGLLDANLNTSGKWKTRVIDTLLNELGSDVRILHTGVDSNSSYGVVYLRMGSAHEAQEAYEILQRSSFNGRPVSVKFLRTEVYFNRFPEAKYSNVPLDLSYRAASVSSIAYF